jgi:hypothetical protein
MIIATRLENDMTHLLLLALRLIDSLGDFGTGVFLIAIAVRHVRTLLGRVQARRRTHI